MSVKQSTLSAVLQLVALTWSTAAIFSFKESIVVIKACTLSAILTAECDPWDALHKIHNDCRRNKQSRSVCTTAALYRGVLVEICRLLVQLWLYLGLPCSIVAGMPDCINLFCAIGHCIL